MWWQEMMGKTPCNYRPSQSWKQTNWSRVGCDWGWGEKSIIWWHGNRKLMDLRGWSNCLFNRKADGATEWIWNIYIFHNTEVQSLSACAYIKSTSWLIFSPIRIFIWKVGDYYVENKCTALLLTHSFLHHVLHSLEAFWASSRHYPPPYLYLYTLLTWNQLHIVSNKQFKMFQPFLYTTMTPTINILFVLEIIIKNQN